MKFSTMKVKINGKEVKDPKARFLIILACIPVLIACMVLLVFVIGIILPIILFLILPACLLVAVVGALFGLPTIKKK